MSYGFLDQKSVAKLSIVLKHAEKTPELRRALSSATAIHFRRPTIYMVESEERRSGLPAFALRITVDRGEIAQMDNRSCRLRYTVTLPIYDEKTYQRARKVQSAIRAKL